MTDLPIKTDTVRINWYSSDEPQSNPTEGPRWRISGRPYVWRPATDVYETEDAIIIRIEIAGMREADFSIALFNRNLIVRGIRPDVNEKRAFYQMEIPFGEFSTEIELPFPVTSNGVEALYRDGFLRIILPKTKPHQIKIEQTENT
jgi:HSP20 family protein